MILFSSGSHQAYNKHSLPPVEVHLHGKKLIFYCDSPLHDLARLIWPFQEPQAVSTFFLSSFLSFVHNCAAWAGDYLGRFTNLLTLLAVSIFFISIFLSFVIVSLDYLGRFTNLLTLPAICLQLLPGYLQPIVKWDFQSFGIFWALQWSLWAPTGALHITNFFTQPNATVSQL